MTRLTYKDSGVDIEAADRFIDRIRPATERTRRPEVLGGIGGFGGLFALPPGRYRSPVLVAGTDGVGTKLKLAFELCDHRKVGIDLVAMCINDIIVVGAEPLFFLDYYATGKLEVEVGAEIVEGIAVGCEQSGCALLGGETAEMPGFYPKGEYDLAGFAVGIVERSEIVDGQAVQRGDCVIGLGSSGLHSNGFSLARKLVEALDLDLHSPRDDLLGATLGAALLEPTRIYARAIQSLSAEIPVRAMAHITGGGLPGNVSRCLPKELSAALDPTSWERPPVFDVLAEGVSPIEQYRAFNMGVGMVVVVRASDAGRAVELLRAAGEKASVIGEIIDREQGIPVQIHGLIEHEETYT